MLETECFKELNVWGPDGGPTPDLIEDQPPPPPRRGFFDRLFRRRRVRFDLTVLRLGVQCAFISTNQVKNKKKRKNKSLLLLPLL